MTYIHPIEGISNPFEDYHPFASGFYTHSYLAEPLKERA